MTATAAPAAGLAQPGEVVTEARMRPVDVPHPDGPVRVALLTLDNGRDHTRPNTFGPAGLASLDAALDEAFALPGVEAVAVTGKPFVFAAGADLTGMAMIATPEQGRAIAQLGHRVFGRLGTAPVPTFALVNGAALGGGLELALHCGYRTISADVRNVALPECSLGLVPGWGGCYLLPNLIGIESALQVIVQNPLANNRMLRAADVQRLGIADLLLEPADFLERSLAWAAGIVRGDVTVERPEPARGPRWGMVAHVARGMLDERLHGAAPAPYRALELVAAAGTADRDAAFAAEDEALAELVVSPELAAGLYAFDLVQRRAKRPAGRPDPSLARPVTQVGVVGAGLMAAQLALLFARRLEVPVVLTDLDEARLARGVGWAHAEVAKLAGMGRISPDQANRLTGLLTGSLDRAAAFADADLVIEAVFEDPEVKAQVFAEVEAVVSDTCVLATNTSSLSVADMAAGLAHPERVVGMHFFNPVSAMPLLEVVRAPATDDATLATAFAVGATLKKSAVLVADAPAFVVNRVLTRLMGEVIGALDEGTPVAVADAALAPLGLPMSPLALLGLVGPAVALHVAETLHAAFPDRFGVSPGLARLVAAGKRGVYGPDGSLDPDVAAYFPPAADPAASPTADDVRSRALTAVAQEIRALLDDGVVAAPQDVDLCLLLGAGWPFHLGGITPYLDRSGIAAAATGRRFSPAGAGGG